MTLRQRLGEKAPEVADVVWEAFQAALNATKSCGARAECPSCGHKFSCANPIPDHRQRLEAATKLSAEVYGRPGTNPDAEGGGRETVIVWDDLSVYTAALGRMKAEGRELPPEHERYWREMESRWPNAAKQERVDESDHEDEHGYFADVD